MLASNNGKSATWFITITMLLCGHIQVNAQTETRVDTRIRDLIVASHPEYETSDYRLSIHGQRMIGLNFPVSDWFFSVEQYPPPARTGYVYNPTSIPCQQHTEAF